MYVFAIRQFVCVHATHGAARQQPRITCHKLVLPSIANADTGTGVYAAFREKCLEVLPAYLMRLDVVSSNAIS